MKPKNIVFFLLLVTIQSLHPKEHIMLKGCIDSGELKKVPSFKIYYDGIETKSNPDGFFTIPLEQKLDNYSLLICKDFSPEFVSVNTVKQLTFNTERTYKFYSLQKATIPLLQEKIDGLKRETFPLEEKAKQSSMRVKLIEKQIALLQASLEATKNSRSIREIDSLTTRKNHINEELKELEKTIVFNTQKINLYEEKSKKLREANFQSRTSDFWIITQKRFKDGIKKAIIPDNCVVACLNAKTVSSVESWSFPIAQNFVAFPRIILQNNLETRNEGKIQSVTRSSLKSELFSLGTKVFHEARPEQIRIEPTRPNVQVALVQ